YYVGVTDDFYRRLQEHNTSERNTFTSKYRPWKIAAVFQCADSLSEARKIENFIKKQKSRKLIEKMINDEPLYGILTKLVRVPYRRD
ncbi:MAG: GIY-YIG nuclease family protein, partial [Bacteroidales bacterium]